ncbi:flavodoxin domain-containing protein [Tardiphaga sp. vice352]|uniref:flavodoxin domain-containing protein n=1 Tax=Tardiphaga sp. vice352 TaxID=2592816 RepID=UPI001FF03C4D|nr:flavodoxin domain-containing protein [Tardiphaga sp. vice352]
MNLRKHLCRTATPQERSVFSGGDWRFEQGRGANDAAAAKLARWLFRGLRGGAGRSGGTGGCAKPRASLTVLYASESGNAEGLAIKAKKAAQKHGLDARVIDMADADMGILANAKNLIVYVATWGEGEPPGRAADFYHALMSDVAPRLDDVRFAVLALGDTAYTQFCATGNAIDARLEALGASRAADRIDLDLDFAKQAVEWTQGAPPSLRRPMRRR